MEGEGNVQLNRDENKYVYEKVNHLTTSYHSVNMMTDQSRATHPAWSYLDKPHHRWGMPLHNYQDKSMVTFAHNVSSRTQQKNIFEKNLENR